MSLFSHKHQPTTTATTSQSPMAEMALSTIHDGVIIADNHGVVQYINPAAVSMTEIGSSNNAIGLDYGLLLKMESKDGQELSDTENEFVQAMQAGRPLERFVGYLIARMSNKKIPIALSVAITNGGTSNRIITFRNITKELAEESEQAEFISTASHEMRTPVASIEGYLSLALNPQTATIDERAKGYLESAHAASKHLGKLFQDLLDATKLDDGHIRPHPEPVEMVGTIKQISDNYIMSAKDAKIKYTFGTDKDQSSSTSKRRLTQVVYGYIDIDFMTEIMNNLIENAIKYTPAGGSLYVNVLGDGDKVLINVTDTGIGISSDDLQHIFQKFYRADNSDTRTIGGTGLGLYIVKQRVEAMGGRVWAESAFGEGSTFYVSLPRLTSEEYEKRVTILRNTQAMPVAAQPNLPHPANVIASGSSAPPAMPLPQAPPPTSPPRTSSATPAPPAPPAPPTQPTITEISNNVNNPNGGTI